MYGQNGTFGIAYQESFGVTSAPSAAILTTSLNPIPIIGETLTLNNEDLMSQALKGRFDESESIQGYIEAPGDISAEVTIDTLGIFLKAMMGDPTQVTSGSLETYTFEPRTSDFDTYTANNPIAAVIALDADNSSAHVFYNLAAQTLEVSVANKELATCKLGVVGGVFTTVAKTAPSYSTDSLYTWDVTSVDIDGAANADIENISITINEALESSSLLDGKKSASKIKRNGYRTVDVAGNMLFTSYAEFNEFEQRTERRVQLTMSPGFEVQSGYPESIHIDIPSFRYTTFEANMSGPNLISAAFTGKAKYNTGSGTAITFTLTTTHGAF